MYLEYFLGAKGSAILQRRKTIQSVLKYRDTNKSFIDGSKKKHCEVTGTKTGHSLNILRKTASRQLAFSERGQKKSQTFTDIFPSVI